MLLQRLLRQIAPATDPSKILGTDWLLKITEAIMMAPAKNKKQMTAMAIDMAPAKALETDWLLISETAPPINPSNSAGLLEITEVITMAPA